MTSPSWDLPGSSYPHHSTTISSDHNSLFIPTTPFPLTMFIANYYQTDKGITFMSCTLGGGFTEMGWNRFH